MGRKNTKGTQKVSPIIDASVESPPYETALGMTNTEEAKRGKQDKQVDLHSCKCKNKKTKNVRKRTRTWESLKELYGDTDTTEVWDNRQQKPKMVFSPKLHKTENPKNNMDESENNDVVIHPTSNVKDTPAKLSLIGLYRRHKNNRNKKKIGHYANENSMDTDVIPSPYPEPKVKFVLGKKTKKVKPNYANPNIATGVICTQGPCREALENLYHLQGLKYNPNQQDEITYSRTKSKVRNPYNETTKKEKNKTKTLAKENKIVKKLKNKQVKVIKTTKGLNVGYGDQITPILLKKRDVKDVLSKYSFIDKMMGHTICKCKNNNGSKLQTDGDRISPVPLKKHDLQDLQCMCSFFDKMMGHTICKCKNNNGSKLQTDGDRISPVPLKKHDLQDLQCKCSFFDKMMGHTICKCKNNNGSKLQTDGDRISPVPLKKHDLQDLQCKCSFFDKMMGHTICKCENNNGITLQTSSNVNNDNIKKEKLKTKKHTRENKNIKKSMKKQAIPLKNQDQEDSILKMKVNLTDMRVINSSEVNEKIRKLGRTEKHMSCICPSHVNEVCERGPCRNALENPHTRFDCKCRKQNIIECKDSTCDLKIGDIKVRSIKKKKPRPSVYNEEKKPLFEVMLDPAKMKIINSNELKDIIREASQNKIICPTGICNTMSKQKNIPINCKCVGKKLSPFINECEERTCRDEVYPEKRCKLSYLCSRVFSKSENFTGQDRNRKRRPIRGHGYGRNIERNGVNINLPRGRTPRKGTYVGGRLSDVWCKCFCECDVKKNEETLDKEKLKKTLNKKKTNQRRRRRRKGFFRKKKKDNRTLTEKILDCLEREQEECEYRVIRKSKEYKKNEKKAIKENKKILAEQNKAYKTNQHHWGWFTNLISGILNVGLESVRTVFKIAFTVIGDPISSYIYVKEKIKNPPAAIIRIIEWFYRTWRNKSSAIAKAVEDSAKLKVIADQIEDTAIYNVLAFRSKTPRGKMEQERKTRIRKRRMQKRHDEALYSCRHMMLTTMRKRPCLWFYHICPDMYPQCLGLLQFINNFVHIVIYCCAVMCWTPCIVACEMCRACMCCFFCTN